MEIRDLSERATAVVRLTTALEELPTRMGEGFGEVYRYLTGAGVQPAGPPFAMYFNMDMTQLEVELGFPVPEPIAASGRVMASKLPGGRAVVGIHVGPYDTLEQTYAKLMDYVEREGLHPESFMYECYLNDPDEVPRDQLQTEIYFPLRD